MYTCGPTVYRHAHIGNLRTYITADVLRRVLQFDGLEIRQALNITDVGHMTDDSGESGEDKMLLAVADEGLSPKDIADKYTQFFMEHSAALNILPASRYPKASDHIEEMLAIIVKLIEIGHAYEVDGTVYFDVDSFPAYGRLSQNTREHLRQGARTVEVDPAKRNSYDFTLWRASSAARLMKWTSPWGEGYPGWHIECSAMSLKHLGERFDIHTGGSDNIFPHHEDEIAQSEGFLGHEVVGYWLHGHHLLSDGHRMAKSAKNYYILDDILEHGLEPLAFRYLVMQARYRSQMNFTWPALESAQRGLQRMRRKAQEWGPASSVESEAALSIDEEFRRAMFTDLDTPAALKVLSKLESLGLPPGESAGLIASWDLILGLDLLRYTQGVPLPMGAGDLLGQRQSARAAKDFAEADRLRAALSAMGVGVADTPDGQIWTVSRSRDVTRYRGERP